MTGVCLSPLFDVGVVNVSMVLPVFKLLFLVWNYLVVFPSN